MEKIHFSRKNILFINVNIKAHTAKNMSLRFILLIIAGYIAGIIAKISRGAINYVLAVYILNLVIVSVNVVVYFINKNADKKMMAAEQAIQKTVVKSDMHVIAESQAV